MNNPSVANRGAPHGRDSPCAGRDAGGVAGSVDPRETLRSARYAADHRRADRGGHRRRAGGLHRREAHLHPQHQRHPLGDRRHRDLPRATPLWAAEAFVAPCRDAVSPRPLSCVRREGRNAHNRVSRANLPLQQLLHPIPASLCSVTVLRWVSVHSSWPRNPRRALRRRLGAPLRRRMRRGRWGTLAECSFLLHRWCTELQVA
jgi:hypothetical protein